MKFILVLAALLSTATALHCFEGTLLVDSYNKLPPKDCGNIDQCINGTMESEEGGLFQAGCNELVIATYGKPERYVVNCTMFDIVNSCRSIDVPGSTAKGTLCCCDDDWCNKSAFGIHSLAFSLVVVSLTKFFS